MPNEPVIVSERDVSQHGEQPILLDYFYRRNKPVHHILVDVGAFGKEMSNSWALLCRPEWKGVLIEPDPDRIKIVQRDFGRKKVVILNVAAGWEDKEIDFHLHSELGHNSFIENWYPQDDTGKTIKIRTRPLADILTECGIPWDFDLL
jgi:FkbM family methyltransferase